MVARRARRRSGAILRVRLSTPEFDFATGRWEYRLRAELVVDGQRQVILGPEPEWIDLSMRVIEPETGAVLGFEEGPERWMRALPSAYRAGDVRVDVGEDDPDTG